MKISKTQLLNEAQEKGYKPEIMEKVILLLNFLEQMNKLEFLHHRLALKGGTALNLFCFDNLPRLSVDLDFNYVGAIPKEQMHIERNQIEENILLLARQNKYELDRYPRRYAGGKMVLRYNSVLGNKGNIELDLNFMYRIPLWGVDLKSSPEWPKKVTNVPVLTLYELVAGKLNALFNRVASRDLFDCYGLFKNFKFETEKLRLAFVIYISMSRKSWQELKISDVSYDVEDLKNRLLPVLQRNHIPKRDTKTLKFWANHLVEFCHAQLASLVSFKENEKEFMSLLQDERIIKPEVLTRDRELAQRIAEHPALHWRAKNLVKT